MALVTKTLGIEADAIAPDGSEVRLLATAGTGSMAHFRLKPGAVAVAVAHKTVEELWFFVGGRGRMWLRQGDVETVVDAVPGVSLAIPVGASFQFRTDGDEPLEAVGVTIPPWPGSDEAYPVEGAWEPTV